MNAAFGRRVAKLEAAHRLGWDDWLKTPFAAWPEHWQHAWLLDPNHCSASEAEAREIATRLTDERLQELIHENDREIAVQIAADPTGAVARGANAVAELFGG